MGIAKSRQAYFQSHAANPYKVASSTPPPQPKKKKKKKLIHLHKQCHLMSCLTSAEEGKMDRCLYRKVCVELSA